MDCSTWTNNYFPYSLDAIKFCANKYYNTRGVCRGAINTFCKNLNSFKYIYIELSCSTKSLKANKRKVYFSN